MYLNKDGLIISFYIDNLWMKKSQDILSVHDLAGETITHVFRTPILFPSIYFSQQQGPT